MKMCFTGMETDKLTKKQKRWLLKRFLLAFPGGTADENPPVNAGDMGSISWSGKISHGFNPGLGRFPRRAAKPMCYNYQAYTPGPRSRNY